MKKETLLIILIALLLLLNFGTLGFMFFSGRGGPPHGPRFGKHGPAELIIQRLELDEQQQMSFETMREQHHSNMVSLDKQMEETVKTYLSFVGLSDSTKIDSLQQAIGKLEIQRASVTYQHFKDLRSICSPAQQEKFDVLLPELFRMITSPPPPDNRKHSH